MSKADCVRARAQAYIGMPYQLGEEGPYVVGPEQTAAADVDCSGLIYAIFRDCGVLYKGRPLWRDTADGYWRLAQPISQPGRVGDMCWFPREGRKTHIALYLGDDTVIEAGYHGPGNVYPGRGYVGTCTIAQMNARGAVWGRIRELDIYEEDEMTEEQQKMLARALELLEQLAVLARQGRVSDVARSYGEEVLMEQQEALVAALVDGDRGAAAKHLATAAKLEGERAQAVAAEKRRLGLT